MEKKSEIDRNRREMEASGSTLPSARVFRKFDKSRPPSFTPFTPLPRSPSHSLLLSSFISQFRHTRRSPERAMKFPRRPNLSLFPRRSGPGPDIPQAFLPESFYRHSRSTDLAWIHILPSLSRMFLPVCSQLTTYFAFSDFCESIIEHDLDSHKKVKQKRERKK